MKVPENTGYELPPVGTHKATCFGFSDTGTQSTAYGPKRQILLTWEIDGPRMKNGNPFTASRIFTFSRHEKAPFRAIVEGMIGKKLDSTFDTKTLIGLPCLISIKHNDNGDTVFANVETAVPIPAGNPAPGPIMSTPIYLSLDVDEFDEDTFRSLPEKRQAKISASPEWRDLVAAKKLRGMSSSDKLGGDDVPF